MEERTIRRKRKGVYLSGMPYFVGMPQGKEWGNVGSLSVFVFNFVFRFVFLLLNQFQNTKTNTKRL